MNQNIPKRFVGAEGGGMELKRHVTFDGDVIGMEEDAVIDEGDKVRVLESPEIKCSDVERLFGEYVDGDLPLSLKMRLDDHVKVCPQCREFTKGYLQTIALAKTLQDRPGPMPRGVR